MHLPVGGPAGTGNVFLGYEDDRKHKLFEINTCLGPGAQKLF